MSRRVCREINVIIVQSSDEELITDSNEFVIE